MRRHALVLATLFLGCSACGKVDDQADANPAPQCDLSKPFGEPQPLVELYTDDPDGGPSWWRPSEELGSLSRDELTLYFTRGTPAMWQTTKTIDYHIYVAKRSNRTAPFSVPALLDALTTPTTPQAEGYDALPAITGDGLTMYFSSDGFGVNGVDIFAARRSNTTASFSYPSRLFRGDVTTGLFVTDDGGTLFFSTRDILDKIAKLYSATCASNGCTQPERFLDFGENANYVVMSADRLTAFYVTGGYNVVTNTDDSFIYTRRRSKPTDPFGPQLAVSELNNRALQFLPRWLSPNGCTLYMDGREPNGRPHVFVASR